MTTNERTNERRTNEKSRNRNDRGNDKQTTGIEIDRTKKGHRIDSEHTNSIKNKATSTTRRQGKTKHHQQGNKANPKAALTTRHQQGKDTSSIISKALTRRT